ncbi:hypothetical protein [Mammaliicoccus sciuri]|uniref:hypothetical protein n=1 Tax=Mammaliicoccus sciuri TaxID=1296 RepID=UPI003F54BC62
MDIKGNLFVSNIKYKYFKTNEDTNIKPFKDLDLNKIIDLSNEDLALFLQFNIIGLEEISDKLNEKDGIAILTYSKLYSNELRFEGMSAAGIIYPNGIMTDFGMSINKPNNIQDIENMYIKVLYVPNALSPVENNTDPFYFMTNETEEELVKLSFPIKLFMGGKN